MASPTSINKLKGMQNAALRACTGCTRTRTYNICMTKPTSFPYRNIYNYMHRMSDKKHKTPSHPLYRYTTYNTSQRLIKPTTFNNSRYTTNIPTDPCTVTTADIKANMCDIHTRIVFQHLAARDNNKILGTHPPQVSSTEENLPLHTRRTLAQLRTNKFFSSYHIYTKSTPQHTHHPSAPFVALTNIPHKISSVAHRYAPRCRPWICGGIPPVWQLW